MSSPLRDPVPYVVRFSEPMMRQERELATAVSWLFGGQDIDDTRDPVTRRSSLRPAFVFADGGAAAKYRAAMGYLWETAGRTAGMLSAVSEPL